FFFSGRRRHTRFSRDWSSDVCSSDLLQPGGQLARALRVVGDVEHAFGPTRQALQPARNTGGGDAGDDGPVRQRQVQGAQGGDGEIGRAAGRGRVELAGGAAGVRAGAK